MMWVFRAMRFSLKHFSLSGLYRKPMFLDMHKAANFYCVQLQDFTLEVGRYGVTWIQWCIRQLADDDFILFFKRAKAGLNWGKSRIMKTLMR
ncbi:hypothetical protein VitviT2T_019985 [Vitis vinifera]|uniref:Alpha N-terminal protein methyltransferase 1 n=1 Tax=Vitis vinifera TaxID=29760 RepID=A0ABY9D2G4_VITVI|nr:hypothetical protein VitviT2T_019985 [Vitis vinifera]